VESEVDVSRVMASSCFFFLLPIIISQGVGGSRTKAVAWRGPPSPWHARDLLHANLVVVQGWAHGSVWQSVRQGRARATSAGTDEWKKASARAVARRVVVVAFCSHLLVVFV